MQRFFNWLGTRLFSEPSEEDLYGANPRLEFDTDLSGRIEEVGPGKNVLIRNKYLREDTGTHETLKIIDDSIIDTGEETGFDPYNTGQFDRSRNWGSRTRK